LWGLNIALRNFIKTLGKNAAETTLHQSKLLCLDLAAAASPRPRGVKGLAAAIPKIWGKRIAGNVGAIVKGARALSLVQIARFDDASVFRNGFYPTKALPTRRVIGYRRTATGAVRERYQVSPLYRINQAAQKNPQVALKNLRQVLKNHLGGTVPTVYNNFMGRAVDQYYKETSNKAKGGKFSRVFINYPDVREEREKLVDSIIPHIGTVKAGWVQAGLAIPVKGGARIPQWLLSKRTVGAGSHSVSEDMQIGVVLTNGKGNAIGMNDRTGYVAKTIRWRKQRIITNLENAIKATTRQWQAKKFGSVSLELAPGKSNGEEPPY
jgi:hypothetical protein